MQNKILSLRDAIEQFVWLLKELSLNPVMLLKHIFSIFKIPKIIDLFIFVNK